MFTRSKTAQDKTCLPPDTPKSKLSQQTNKLRTEKIEKECVASSPISVSQAVSNARTLFDEHRAAETKVTAVQIANVPPLFAKTVDEIDVCPPCNQTVSNEGILCEGCNTWFHKSCSNLTTIKFQELSLSRTSWYCSNCSIPLSQAHTEFRNVANTGEVNTDVDIQPQILAPDIPPPTNKSGCLLQSDEPDHLYPCHVSHPSPTETSASIDHAVWGVLKGTQIIDAVNHTYSVIVKWRKNLFQVPTGKAGQEFIEEVRKTLSYYVVIW